MAGGESWWLRPRCAEKIATSAKAIISVLSPSMKPWFQRQRQHREVNRKAFWPEAEHWNNSTGQNGTAGTLLNWIRRWDFIRCLTALGRGQPTTTTTIACGWACHAAVPDATRAWVGRGSGGGAAAEPGGWPAPAAAANRRTAAAVPWGPGPGAGGRRHPTGGAIPLAQKGGGAEVPRPPVLYETELAKRERLCGRNNNRAIFYVWKRTPK